MTTDHGGATRGHAPNPAAGPAHDPSRDREPRATADAHDPLAGFAIDARSATAPFRQVHDAIVAAVSSGELSPGSRLPTVRALAARLGIAVNTVAAAYRSLESAGIVEGRGRAGTFVRLGDDPVEAEARRIALDAAGALRALGVGRDRAVRLIGDAFDGAALD